MLGKVGVVERYKRSKAGGRHKEGDLIDRAYEESVLELEIGADELDSSLSAVTEKIVHNSHLLFRTGAIVWGSIFLLFASLKGVEFEVSLLGVKLNALQNIKEWVLLVFSGFSVLYGYVSYENTALRSIRRALVIKRFGREYYNIIRRSFLPFTVDTVEPHLNHYDKYSPSGSKMWLDLGYLIVVMFAFLLLLALTLYIVTYIGLDVWRTPNVDPAVGRSIVIVSLGLYYFGLILEAVRRLGVFWYVDSEEFKRNPFYNEETGELSEELKGFISAEVRKDATRPKD